MEELTTQGNNVVEGKIDKGFFVLKEGEKNRWILRCMVLNIISGGVIASLTLMNYDFMCVFRRIATYCWNDNGHRTIKM